MKFDWLGFLVFHFIGWEKDAIKSTKVVQFEDKSAALLRVNREF